MAIDLDNRSKLFYAYCYVSYKCLELFRWYCSSYVTVTTRLGRLRGVVLTSSNVSSESPARYAQFIGVPYARPPIGELRFREPQPAEPWTGTFDAVKESKACQKDFLTSSFCGQEDCLHLNIFTKQLESDDSRASRRHENDHHENGRRLVPVMVFVHGGAFMFGNNNKELYNPEFLLRKNVVLVTINYRLGAFGFLSVDDLSASAPGNAGLKDQAMALRWIRDNIAAFGGDPDNVTLFGESAGACSVHFHMVSPMSRGLFHKAVAMSGSTLMSWSICPLQRLPERLATAVGWDGTGGTAAMMATLRSVSPERLLKAQESLVDRVEKRQYMDFTFGPTVEPAGSIDGRHADGQSCFIGQRPELMGQRPWSHDTVPMIFSVCSAEGLLVHKATQRSRRLIENLELRFQDMVPLDLMGGVRGDRDGERAKAVAAEFRRYYFGDDKMTIEQLERFEQMMGDKMFLYGLYRAIRQRTGEMKSSLFAAGDTPTQAAAAPTWMLRFDVESKVLNFSKFMFAGRDTKGACHADDCHFLFRTCLHPTIAEGSADMLAIDRFVNLMTEFATTGNPNGDYTRSIVEWEPAQPNVPLRCLNLSNELKFVEMPELSRMQFWDDMYAKYDDSMNIETIEKVPTASL